MICTRRKEHVQKHNLFIVLQKAVARDDDDEYDDEEDENDDDDEDVMTMMKIAFQQEINYS